MAVSGAKGKRALVASVAPRWHFCYRSLPKPLICRVSSAVEQRFCNVISAATPHPTLSRFVWNFRCLSQLRVLAVPRHTYLS